MAITVTLHVILILLLFLFGMSYMDPPIERGIAIRFGTTETGSGTVSSVQSPPSAPAASASRTEAKIEEEVAVQDLEEAPVVTKDTKTESSKSSEKESPSRQPDRATSDALSSILNAPKSEGGAGDDATPGDKGSPDGDPGSSSYYGTGKGLDGDGNYQLGGRQALNKEKFVQECNEAGIVVVRIEVDRTGRVVQAMAGVRGTTNNAKCLLEPARRAALATRFNPDEKAPAKQTGKIIYNFSLSE